MEWYDWLLFGFAVLILLVMIAVQVQLWSPSPSINPQDERDYEDWLRSQGVDVDWVDREHGKAGDGK